MSNRTTLPASKKMRQYLNFEAERTGLSMREVLESIVYHYAGNPCLWLPAKDEEVEDDSHDILDDIMADPDTFVELQELEDES